MSAAGFSRPEDVPALKALWKQAFGDEDALIDAFFRRLYVPEQVLVCREEGRVAAMACWLRETVCCGSRGWPAAYLYAVATDPAHRGRGLCSELLSFAAGCLESRGVRVLLLVPGSPSLRQFYAARGFRDYTTVHTAEVEVSPVSGIVEPVTAPVYLELREQFLSGQSYVSCPVPVLEFQAAAAALYGGGLLRLEKDGREGCACVARDGGGRAVIYELLWPGNGLEGASLAAGVTGAARAFVRKPGGQTAFAMARWLGEVPNVPPPYLGLALD